MIMMRKRVHKQLEKWMKNMTRCKSQKKSSTSDKTLRSKGKKMTSRKIKSNHSILG
jgi:hypothetical protein